MKKIQCNTVHAEKNSGIPSWPQFFSSVRNFEAKQCSLQDFCKFSLFLTPARLRGLNTLIYDGVLSPLYSVPQKSLGYGEKS